MFQIDLPLLTAFLGGILSFLSPCLLPVLPGYFGYMSGILLSNDGIKGKKLLAHAVAYSLGFAIILMLVGAAIGGIAKTLAAYRKILEIFGGILLIIFGIHLAGIFQIKKLLSEKRWTEIKNENHSVFKSFAAGVVFAISWSPCFGPILGSIATITAVETGFAKGMILFLAYSLGFTIPLILLAFFASSFSKNLKRLEKVAKYSGIIGGVVIIILGILLITGTYSRIANSLRFKSFEIEELLVN